MTDKEERQLQIMSAYIGKPLTKEQMEFASDFTKDTISFSDPGTGKTHTLVAGILMAQCYHDVKGAEINCMSFTNAAVYELKGRYDSLAKKLMAPPTVEFNTFHRLSRLIMTRAYPDIKVDRTKLSEDLEDVCRYMGELGYLNVDFDYAKQILYAINDLNSSMTFDKNNVLKNFSFNKLNMDIDLFQELRTKWFVRGVIQGVIPQGDIPLYCLYALMSKPEIIKEWKGKYKIMIVDEFQDLSLLHLKILSYIATTLIVIGDMKQQIYYFNGACPNIVREYMRMHPDARICNLTQSFRCSNVIADFATNLILPNDKEVKCFKGIKDGGNVSIIERRNLNWEQIAKDIKDDINKNTISGARDVMFLYRNTASAIPIIDKLYSLKIPFRCTKFNRIQDIPMFKELCTLASAAWQPKDISLATEAFKLFPEFKYLKYKELPIPVKVMQQTGLSLFEIKYNYTDRASLEILNAMEIAHNKIQQKKSAGVVLNNLLPVYEKYIIKNQWWRLDRTKEFYLGLVAPICNIKEYPQMIIEEDDKLLENNKAINANIGIRCYTIHSAKGLEADVVYILDCDKNIFPNTAVIDKKIKIGCEYDASNDVRSERNLLYVAVTRAKEECIISYSEESPTSLLVSPEDNEYTYLDSIYEEEQEDFDDVREFLRLFKLGDKE